MKTKRNGKPSSKFCYIMIAFGIMLLMSVQGYAQSILNGNFENWTSTNYDKLINWENSNTESVPKTGLISVSQTTSSQSGLAIKIETVSNGIDTIGGYIINTAGDPFGGEGGFPYAAQPTNITGYYKYNLPVNDTALLLVIFKSGGAIVSTDVFKIKGSGQLTSYASFSFPLSLTVIPDTVIIAAASSNLIAGTGIEIGSTLYLDGLAFTGSGPMPAIDNGNFENWTTNTFDQLTGWDYYEVNLNVAKTLDSYKGVHALKLVSTIGSSGGAEVGSVTSGIQTINGTVGGLPFSNQIDTVFGYYKYFNNSGDNATVTVQFFSNGVNVGGNQLSLAPSSTYIKFEIPINLPFAPDTMRIDIASSQWPFINIGMGSTLYIDEIQLSSTPLNTGINEFNPLQSFVISPNPANNYFTIDLSGIPKNVDVIIADINGKIIPIAIGNKTTTANSEKIEVNTGAFAEGVYFIQVQTSDFIVTKKVIIAK